MRQVSSRERRVESRSLHGTIACVSFFLLELTEVAEVSKNRIPVPAQGLSPREQRI